MSKMKTNNESNLTCFCRVPPKLQINPRFWRSEKNSICQNKHIQKQALSMIMGGFQKINMSGVKKWLWGMPQGTIPGWELSDQKSLDSWKRLSRFFPGKNGIVEVKLLINTNNRFRKIAYLKDILMVNIIYIMTT